jgi:predicted dehydrogenase
MQRFTVGIIGTSFGSMVHAVGFQRHPGFELAAIAGRDMAKTRHVAESLGVSRATSDWRELVAADPPDLVCIVTPVDLHHPMMIAALDRGCHVLCEKPTAMNRHQAEEMRARARRVDRVAAINHEFRFFPARAHALEIVRSGGIGVPRRGEILGRYPIWHSPQARGMTWLSDRARGGGILGALGSHHTDCLRTFFGEPVAVLASVRTDQPRRGPATDGSPGGIATADDACTVHYIFDGGATALVDLNATTPYRWERFEVQGEEASLRWDADGYTLWRIAPGREPEVVETPRTLRLDRREGDRPLVAPFGVIVDRLHRAMRGEAPMAPNFDDAVAVQCVLDAARASAAAGARIAVERPGTLAAAGTAT